MKFHVLRIGHTEATDVDAVRAGETVDASSHNEAANAWAKSRLRDFSQNDWFDLVVMDERGKHITFEVEMQVRPVMRLANCQELDA